MVQHQFSITDCWREGLLWHPDVLGCLQPEAQAGLLHENQRICHPTIWHARRPHANMQNKSPRLYDLSGSVGKFQFVLQSSSLWWTYNSCSCHRGEAAAFAHAPTQYYCARQSPVLSPDSAGGWRGRRARTKEHLDKFQTLVITWTAPESRRLMSTIGTACQQ